MSYLNLALSILLEVIGTSLMKRTDGFTNIIATLGVLICYGGSFYFLSHVIKDLPMGVVYATWSGAGIVLVSIAGFLIYKQSLNLPAIIGIGLIVVGVVVLNLFSQNSAH